MVKKICIATFILVFLASSYVVASENNTGCGIGTMIFKGQDGLVSQVVAVTTNGTFGNQTFGISSGTLDCDKPASFASNEQVNKFVAENMDHLATDIAAGDGEYLNTLAVLMEVPQEQHPTLYPKLQQNFSNIFTSHAVSSTEVIKNIESVLAAG